MSDKISRVHVQIRFKDLDSVGHVNNAVHLTYFEMGRVDFVKRFLGSFDPTKTGFVIVHSEVDYRKPIYLESRIEVQSWIAKVGKTSFTFQHRIEDLENNASPFAEGKTVGVLVDREGAPLQLPDIFNELVVG